MMRATLYIVFAIAVFFLLYLFAAESTSILKANFAGSQAQKAPESRSAPKEKSEAINLPVPYINEAPEDNWSGPWKNACEEATIAMIDSYYRGAESVSIEESKILLQRLFDIQDREYGSNANSDAERTAAIINNHSDFSAQVVRDPSIDDIKKELDRGNPVLAFHRGFDLHNKNIPFLATGSSYHTTVIKGYDDATREFIVNDPGDTKDGPDHTYDYDVFMNSIHDYDYGRNLADGPPTVLFTQKK